MKHLYLALVLCLSSFAAFAQAETEAKAAYLLAEESYGKGDYRSAISYLDQAKKSLGRANSKILYLQIQAEMELAKGNPAANGKILGLISEFEKSPDFKAFNEDKVLEITKAKLVLKREQADADAKAQQSAKAKADSLARIDDLKKRGVELGGIIVYEKDGHGLIVAEADLRKGNFFQARNFCENLELNGFSDWYLPNLEELKLIYANVHLKGIGNLKREYYWSSQRGFFRSGLSFVDGSSDGLGTAVKYNVRPVRKF